MGIKISELTETNQLTEGCCIPVVNNGITKKIKIKNLKTQLNPYFSIEDGHLFADGIDIGEVQGSNGKTAYELACEYGFVGTEQDFAKGLNASVESGLVTEDFVKETVNNAVAEIVANAPEDFNTLKEMSDWISEHEDDATAMNSAIQSNKTKIENEVTARQNADTNLQNQINANKITVDTAMSSTSTNPVQNKVVNTALGNKVDKVSGKGLSTNDYTTTEKNKLAGIAEGANKTTIDSALSTSSTNPVQNKIVTSNINTLSSNLNSKASQSSVDTLTSNLNTLALQVGAMKGSYSCAYVCSSSASSHAKTLSISGFQLSAGAVIKVVFINGNTGDDYSLITLNINNTGAKNTDLTSRKWDKYAILEFYYDGSNWVTLGNPIVRKVQSQIAPDEVYSNHTILVYADGLKEAWFHGTTTTLDSLTVNFPFTFKSASYYVNANAIDTTGASGYPLVIIEKTTSYVKINRAKDACKNWSIYATGY